MRPCASAQGKTKGGQNKGVADRREHPRQAKMHAHEARRLRPRGKRGANTPTRGASGALAERPQVRGQAAGQRRWVAAVRVAIVRWWARTPSRREGAGGEGRGNECAKARKYLRQARVHGRGGGTQNRGRHGVPGQFLSARQHAAARCGQGLVTSAAARHGRPRWPTAPRPHHDGRRQAQHDSESDRLKGRERRRQPPFYGASGWEKDGRKDGRARRGGAEAERPQARQRRAEECVAAAERAKAKGGKADHSRGERGAEKHAERRRRRRTKGADSASAVIFSVVTLFRKASRRRAAASFCR